MSQILNDCVSLQKQQFYHSIIGCCFGTAQVLYKAWIKLLPGDIFKKSSVILLPPFGMGVII